MALVKSDSAESVPGTSAGPGQGDAFRRDIQGLRALAVLMVIAFHARLPLPGGFVGVDVFFVISGFVITSMLHREWQATGHIALGRFFARRFKRLTPALVLLVAATLVGSALALSPFGPQQGAARTALGALLMSANIVITKSTGGYFEAPAASNPLLHTWSLSVEEQFYLVFPLLLIGGWALQRRHPRFRAAPMVVVAVVAAISLGLALRALHHPPGPRTDWLLGFYGPLSRAWEFAVGALLSLAASRLGGTSRRITTALASVGAVMLILSVRLISESTPVPGPWTFLPVVGTLCLTAAGLGQPGFLTRVLGSEPLVRVGNWSYSLYLWHWPFIVLASFRWPDRRWAAVVAAAVSTAPALASYRWIEMPLRRRRGLKGGRLAAVLALILAPALALSVGLLYAADHLWAPRLTTADVRFAFHGEVAWKDHDYRFGGFQPCTDPVLRALFEKAPKHEPRCQQSKPGADVSLALLGDSHAEHVFIGLSEALPATNIMYFTVNGFPSKADPNFAAALDYVLKTRSIRTVIVTAFWAARGVDEVGLADVLRSLRKSEKRVFLTDDVPSFDFDPFGCKVHTTGCSRDAKEFRTAYLPNYQKLLALSRTVPGVRLLETAQYLCNEKSCSMTLGDDILYADPNHLNVLGSRYVGKRMAAEYGTWLN